MKPSEAGAIISAYTGILVGEFSEMHKYVEQLLGRPVWTHEMADEDLWDEVKEKAKPDLERVDKWMRETLAELEEARRD